MGISPMRQSDTLPAWQQTINGDDGNPINVSGATFALVIHNTETGVDTTGAGTFTITSAANGQVTYAWAAADTAVPGTYTLVVEVTIGGGRLSTDPVPWVVKAV